MYNPPFLYNCINLIAYTYAYSRFSRRLESLRLSSSDRVQLQSVQPLSFDRVYLESVEQGVFFHPIYMPRRRTVGLFLI